MKNPAISSADGYNNYQPTPATGDEAARIKAKIDERSAAIPSADSTAKSSGDTGSSDTVSADEASGSTDTSDESDTSSDFSDESDSSDYDASDEEVRTYRDEFLKMDKLEEVEARTYAKAVQWKRIDNKKWNTMIF